MDELVRREMLALLPRLRRFTCGLTGSIADGDDLLQATCERAILHLDQWRHGTRLDSWMYRIARNIHLNELRATGVRKRHLASVNPADQVVDGVRVTESRLSFESARRFVSQLPEEQRSVLLLITVEGRSYQDVADLLDIPVGTVNSRLARARQALAAKMGGDHS